VRRQAAETAAGAQARIRARGALEKRELGRPAAASDDSTLAKFLCRRCRAAICESGQRRAVGITSGVSLSRAPTIKSVQAGSPGFDGKWSRAYHCRTEWHPALPAVIAQRCPGASIAARYRSLRGWRAHSRCSRGTNPGWVRDRCLIRIWWRDGDFAGRDWKRAAQSGLRPFRNGPSARRKNAGRRFAGADQDRSRSTHESARQGAVRGRTSRC
jgi:hypothetical protein